MQKEDRIKPQEEKKEAETKERRMEKEEEKKTERDEMRESKKDGGEKQQITASAKRRGKKEDRSAGRKKNAGGRERETEIKGKSGVCKTCRKLINLIVLFFSLQVLQDGRAFPSRSPHFSGFSEARTEELESVLRSVSVRME